MRLSAYFVLAVSLVCHLTSAHAQTGVSDDRVQVPDGPGSVEGAGDNASVTPNLGAMSYRVPIEVPAGFAGATPSLALSYSSNSGQSVLGMGWSLAVPSIERLTLWGVPGYDADDEFVADGGEQLVRVGVSGAEATYRARFERGFVRYTWHDRGLGGYWTAEYPDGRVGYFGADAAGELVDSARLTGPQGETFRYHLVEVVDVRGHRLVHQYALMDGAPYLTGVSYVFDERGLPRYQVALRYAARADPVHDCKPRFCEETTQRLDRIDIAAGGEQIRSYRLRYDDAEAAGGLSRLAEVTQLGRGGEAYPIRFRFEYSRSLAELCGDATCDGPFVVDMGSVPAGAGVLANNATLVDLNGDGLPDLVDGHQSGAHRIYFAELTEDGGSRFRPDPVPSAVATRERFEFSRPNVQVMDVNGDGFADLVDTLGGGAVLCNHGDGDWSETGCGVTPGGLASLSTAFLSAEGPEAQSTRMVDIDHDRKIDVIRVTGPGATTVYRNTGAEFEVLAADRIDPLDAAFLAPFYTLSDMNGDGLLDYVHLAADGTVEYRANLGMGRWGAMTAIPGSSLISAEVDASSFEDLNNDGLDDLVVVRGQRVKYFLNRSADHFTGPFELTGDPADARGHYIAGLPIHDGAHSLVLYADMNGNGSRDVVWIQDSGSVEYLELFPAPPNLLSRIENGIGSVQEIRYATSLDNRRADPRPWTHVLPYSVIVVDTMDSWVTLTGGEDRSGLHEITQYRYRNGYYDRAEKQFRGFEEVVQTLEPDSSLDSQEGGRTASRFEVGATDGYRFGLLLEQRVFSGPQTADRPLSETHQEYRDCPLADAVADGPRPVRFICPVRTSRVLQEGAPEAEWATVVTETSYDGYGQVILQSELGVTHRGGVDAAGPCEACAGAAGSFGAACGPQCLGDERFTAAEYVDPGPKTGGHWILGRPHTVRRYGRARGTSSEEKTYYDGTDFEGLPAGQLTRGEVTRTTAKATHDSDAVIQTLRQAYDDDGNVVVTLDPLGDPDNLTTHRRAYEYERTGLRVIRTDVFVEDPDGSPYRLRKEYSYDPAFDQIAEATAWMVVGIDGYTSARNPTRFGYDGFGRRISVIRPGDTELAPTSEFAYELADPASRVVARTRTAQGSSPDLEQVRCLDGRGRIFQQRERIADGRYQVSGFAEFNARGSAVRLYQPFEASSAACDVTAPDGVGRQDVRYDAAHREIHRTFPDAALYGEASAQSTAYAPLAMAMFDAEDLDSSRPHANTPTLVHLDGLGRMIAIDRLLDAAGTKATVRAEFDGLGRMSALIDGGGNRKEQTFDLLGRMTILDDPNSGRTRFEYDASGNMLARTDAELVVARARYDGANRMVAQWDEAYPTNSEIRYRYDFGGECEPRDCRNAEGRAIEVTYPLLSEVTSRLGGGGRGADHFGFDARGQVILQSRVLAGLPLTTRREYDNAGREVALNHPDGRRVERRLDGAARVIGVKGVVDLVEYDDRGLPVSLRFASGAQNTWTFDARRRVGSLRVEDASRTAVADYRYRRDRQGNILGLVNGAVQPAQWGAEDAAFEYDAWYRLTGANYGADGAAVERQAWGYDLLDNLLSATSSLHGGRSSQPGDMAHGAHGPNSVDVAGGMQMTYDRAGRMVGRGDVALEWDFLGRLVRAGRGGQDLARLSYGANMERVASVEGEAITLYGFGDFELRDGIGVAYPRLGQRRAARLESDGLAAAALGDPAPLTAPDGRVDAADAWIRHAAANDLIDAEITDGADAPLMLRSAARRLLLESGDGYAELHVDHTGNVVAATNAAGEERGRRRFVIPGPEDRQRGFVDRYGFAGQEAFDDIGLVRFEHRWLDPTTRRWTRADPAFASVSALTTLRVGEAANRYAYVGNNFVNMTDPTGLSQRQLLLAAAHAMSGLGRGASVSYRARRTGFFFGDHTYRLRVSIPGGSNHLGTPHAAATNLFDNFARHFPGGDYGLNRRQIRDGEATAALLGAQITQHRDNPTQFTNTTLALHPFDGSAVWRFTPLRDGGLRITVRGRGNGPELAFPAVNNFMAPIVFLRTIGNANRAAGGDN